MRRSNLKLHSLGNHLSEMHLRFAGAAVLAMNPKLRNNEQIHLNPLRDSGYNSGHLIMLSVYRLSLLVHDRVNNRQQSKQIKTNDSIIARASDQDASWTTPWWEVPGTSHRH